MLKLALPVILVLTSTLLKADLVNLTGLSSARRY
jgi:hypothetical protein